MAQVLRCCPAQSTNDPYIGVDQKCNQPAIFCIQHSPHKNSQGLMHQMLPLKHFKKTLQQKKFRMNQKIGILIDQYNNLMDSLIQQIRQLKLRKNIQFSMLWLRQLAKDQEQYELMRQIYRMDFNHLTCSLVHSIYFKIIHNQILQKKSVKQINCYKGIADILQHLSQQKQTRNFLSKKIAQIEGILENGEILKRALPDKLVLKQNIKQVLLQSPQSDFFDIKYNKCRIIKNSRQYVSVFSKYPIVNNVLYHINFNTKYTNVMLGVCTQKLLQLSREVGSQVQMTQNQQSQLSYQSSGIKQFDKHYSKDSIVFNCTNGCVYKDGMFESGSNVLTKGQKELVLKMRITSTNQVIILLGKNILCRQKLDNLIQRNNKQNTQFYLHILLRTEGDSFDVDRDKDISSDQLPARMQFDYVQNNNTFVPINPRQNINFQQIKRRNQQESINVNYLKQQIINGRQKQKQNLFNKKNSNQEISYDFNHLNSSKFIGIGKIKSQSGPSLKQQKIRQDAVKKQIKKLQQKRKQIVVEQKPVLNYKKLNENQKQQKINQIIKKERIDQILNNLKSKPVGSSSQRQNPIVAKKLKQIQQRKNSNLNLNLINSQQIKKREDIKKTIQIKNGQVQQNFQFQLLKPVIVKKNVNNSDVQSSFQTSFYSPMMKSQQIDPMLILQKPLSSKKSSQQESQFPYGQDVFSNTKTIQPPSDDYININKLLPSQKIFKLDDDQSYQFDQQGDSFNPNSGGATPIDKISDFQFAKKSLNLKGSGNNQQKINQMKRNLSPSNKILPTLHQASQKGDQSHVLQAYDIHGLDNIRGPEINIRGEIKMPQLGRSHFSRMDSKEHLNYSDGSSSFMLDKILSKKRLGTEQQKDKLIPKNPRDRNHTIQSKIDIKSQYLSKQGDNSFQIGTVLQPNLRMYSQDSQIPDKSYGKIQKQQHDQSIIDIRGTYI